MSVDIAHSTSAGARTQPNEMMTTNSHGRTAERIKNLPSKRGSARLGGVWVEVEDTAPNMFVSLRVLAFSVGYAYGPAYSELENCTCL